LYPANITDVKRIIFTLLKHSIIWFKFVTMSLDINIKEQLLAKCIEIKEEAEANTLAAMNDAQQSANEYGAPRDRYDSFRAQMMRKRDMLAQQLSAVEEEIRFLRQMNTGGKSTKIEAGALVELNTQTLYILAGIGKLVIDEKTFYVISPVVPLVAAMKDLKKGDSFTFRGTTMKILEIC
jgi:hypothetical protein